MLKMYIAVLDEVPDHMVPVLVAHATLGAHLKFYTTDSIDENDPYYNWLYTSFRKVVLRVNRKEFEQIRNLLGVYLAHESSVLLGEKSCAVVCPRKEIPRVLAFAKMWKPASDIAYDKLLEKAERLQNELSDIQWRDSPGQGMY